METATLRCKVCERPLVVGDVVVPVCTLREGEDGPLVPQLDRTDGLVHARCFRPLPRENPPVPPTLTDEEIAG
jgi:hypothetical protein